MPTEQMRIAISGLYPNDTWFKRVSKMPENQVKAIYFDALKYGRLVPYKPVRKEKPKKVEEPQYVQLSLFDEEVANV